MATRKRYLFRCSGNLKYLENQLTQVNAVLSFDGHKIHVDLCRLCLVFKLQGPIFFCNFFWGCLHMHEDLKLFVLYTDMHWILCVHIYNPYSFVLYIQICIGFKNCLVAEAVFALKMPYFKTITDNLNSSSYNAGLRNIVNLLSSFICKDERVEI